MAISAEQRLKFASVMIACVLKFSKIDEKLRIAKQKQKFISTQHLHFQSKCVLDTSIKIDIIYVQEEYWPTELMDCTTAVRCPDAAVLMLCKTSFFCNIFSSSVGKKHSFLIANFNSILSNNIHDINLTTFQNYYCCCCFFFEIFF